jgi:hypothetical protein
MDQVIKKKVIQLEDFKYEPIQSLWVQVCIHAYDETMQYDYFLRFLCSTPSSQI